MNVMKKLDVLKRNINLFEDIVKEFRSDSEKLNLIREKSNQSFIIDLYTLWETEVKNIIYEFAKRQIHYLDEEKFLKKYIKTVTEGSSYVKMGFLENFNIHSFTVNKSILCESNNLNFKQLCVLIGRIDLDFNENELREIIKINICFEKTMSMIKASNIEKNGMGDDIEEYIYLLVNNRNRIAHNHDIDINYNPEQKLSLINYVTILFTSIKTYLDSRLIQKKISMPVNFQKINLTKLIKGNNSDDKSVILEFETPDKSVDVTLENCFIVKIQKEGIEIFESLNNSIHKYTIRCHGEKSTMRMYFDYKIKEIENISLLWFEQENIIQNGKLSFME